VLCITAHGLKTPDLLPSFDELPVVPPRIRDVAALADTFFNTK
jgi:hypothetical protein